MVIIFRQTHLENGFLSVDGSHEGHFIRRSDPIWAHAHLSLPKKNGQLQNLW